MTDGPGMNWLRPGEVLGLGVYRYKSLFLLSPFDSSLCGYVANRGKLFPAIGCCLVTIHSDVLGSSLDLAHPLVLFLFFSFPFFLSFPGRSFL